MTPRFPVHFKRGSIIAPKTLWSEWLAEMDPLMREER